MRQLFPSRSVKPGAHRELLDCHFSDAERPRANLDEENSTGRITRVGPNTFHEAAMTLREEYHKAITKSVLEAGQMIAYCRWRLKRSSHRGSTRQHSRLYPRPGRSSWTPESCTSGSTSREAWPDPGISRQSGTPLVPLMRSVQTLVLLSYTHT